MIKTLIKSPIVELISVSYITAGFFQTPPSLAQIPSNLSPQCRTQITSSIRNLRRGRTIKIHVEIRDAGEGHPQNRPQKILFAFDGKETNDLMNASEMMTSTARKIIEKCPTVSAFQFGQLHTGWSYTIGIVNGNIEWFKCYEEGQPDFGWGYQRCDL